MASFFLFLLFHKSLKKRKIYYFCKKKKTQTQAADSKRYSQCMEQAKTGKQTKRTLKMCKKLQIKRGKQHLPPANHCMCSACASHLTLLNLLRHVLFSSWLRMRKPRPGEVRWFSYHCCVTEYTAGIKPRRLTLEPGTLHNSTCDSWEDSQGNAD